MRSAIRNAMTLAALTVGLSFVCMAQTSTPNQAPPDLRANADPPPAPDKGSVPPAATANTKPELQPTVDQKIDALVNRVNELENEVKAARAALLADSSDTAAMKAAEKELVAGAVTATASPSANPFGSTPGFSSSAVGQESPGATPAPAAAPEIGAQITTKGEPFPGDWTWLNSNGHAVDSPMSTKYFTLSSGLTRTTFLTTTIPKTTPWVARRKASDPMNGSSSRSALAVTFASTTCADASSPWMGCSPRQHRAMTPASTAETGICPAPTNMFQRHGADIIGM